MDNKEYIEIIKEANATVIKAQGTVDKALDTLNNSIDKNNTTNMKNNLNFCIAFCISIALLSIVMGYFTYNYFNYDTNISMTQTEEGEQTINHTEGGNNGQR